MTFIPLPIMTSVPYYRTEQGEAYLGDSLNLMEELPDKSVNLIFTSPPFALTGRRSTATRMQTNTLTGFWSSPSVSPYSDG